VIFQSVGNNRYSESDARHFRPCDI
jgi:hypothetical protein